MAGLVSPRAYWELVRGNRNFRLLWLAQMVSEVGDWLYSVVLYSLILERTGSAKAVAIAVVLQVLPQVLVSPTAGAVNDRISRRTVMIVSDLARFVIVLAMLFAVRGESIWPIYVLLLLETAMWGFFEPGRSAILPNVTRDERELLVGNALASTTWSISLAVGSALGGVLAVVLGSDAVFVINACSFVLSAFLLSRIEVHEPHAEAKALRASDFVDFRPVIEGFRYISSQPLLFTTLMAKFGLGFMGASYVILPLFGERVFPVVNWGGSAQAGGMLGMSLLMAARGVGALLGPLCGSMWAGNRPERKRHGILIGFLILAVGYISLSAAPNIWVAAAAVMFAHSGGSNIWVFSTTMLQMQAEDKFRGRVFSADYAFFVVAMSATSYAAGVASDMGAHVRTITMATGLLVLIPAAAWAFLALPKWKSAAD